MKWSTVGAALSVILLAACAPAATYSWHKAGATDRDFAQDTAACQYAARRDAGPFVPPTEQVVTRYGNQSVVETRPVGGWQQGWAVAEHDSQVKQFFRLCMEAKGWELVRDWKDGG